MKSKTNKIDPLIQSRKAVRSKMDDTEKSLFLLSREFKKTVRSKASIVSKTVKAALCKELSHVQENGNRLIHGKA